MSDLNSIYRFELNSLPSRTDTNLSSIAENLTQHDDKVDSIIKKDTLSCFHIPSSGEAYLESAIRP